jgi:hypothetical protein
MDTFSFTDVALIFLLLWLCVLSFLLFRVKSSWRKISQGKNQNLAQVLETIINRQELTGKNIAKIAQEISQLGTLTKLSFQKSSLVRYNPFEDTGGDQSFVIALLNGNNSGVVVSSLHSRTGTRVYAKQIVNGKAASHELSKEEREAIEKAIKG